MSVIMGRIISVVGAIVDIDSRVVTAAGEVVKLFEGVAVFVWISCSSFGKGVVIIGRVMGAVS